MYYGHTFFSFFLLLIRRLLGLEPGALAADEIQLLVLSGLAISCALVGTFLMLHRMAMLANALSHTILLGIVVSMMLFPTEELIPVSVLMVAACMTALVTALLTRGLQSVARLQEDASIGLVFSSLFALGILLISVRMRNLHVGLELIMGNADALLKSDIVFVGWICLMNIALITLLFRSYQISAFDPTLARALGLSPGLLVYVLMTQTALTSISSFRCVGVFMVLAFLIAPPLIIRLFVHRLPQLLLGSVVLSVGVVVLGVALSRHIFTSIGIGVSTAGVIVSLFFIFFLLAAVFKLTFSKLRLYYS